MPSSFTPNLHLELQVTGEDNGTWGNNLNNNCFSPIDNAMGRVLSLPLAGADVTLTTDQTLNNMIDLTGVLAANVKIIFPQIGRNYFVRNRTTGNFTVTLQTTAVGGATYAIPQGLSTTIVLNGTDVLPAQPSLASVSPGFIYGLSLSNNIGDPTNDIDIAAGSAASDDTTYTIMRLASALTKRLDAAWAVGTNQGGLDTGSTANITYHVWLIQRSDTGVVDALFSASATSPTMPANYDRKRRIGSIMRVSAAIVPFIQTGDTFVRAVRIQDVSVTNPGTSAVTRTLSVPTGINVFPFGTIQIELTTSSAVTVSCLLTDLAQPDSDPGTVGGSVTLSTLTAGGSQRALSFFGTIKTNTSAQIRSRFNISGAATNFVLHTEGWVDTRGRI